MAQIINFDDKCREIDTLRYAEIIRRRACARMDASQVKHEAYIQNMLEAHEKWEITFNKVVAVTLAAVCIGCVVWILW